MRGFALLCFAAAAVLAAVGLFAFLRWPGRAFWWFWIVAVFLALWGRNCLIARNSDDHDDSPLHAIVNAWRWWR